MKRMLMAVAAAAILAPAVAQAQASWVHVRVDGDEDETVRLNLPVQMAAVALEAARTNFQGATARGDTGGLTLEDLRAMWQSVRDAGDVEVANIQDGDDRVRIFRQGDRIHIEADARGETVRVQMPVEIADVLLAEDGDPIDLQAVVEELARRGEPDLVNIISDDGTVRVWVDERAEQDL